MGTKKKRIELQLLMPARVLNIRHVLIMLLRRLLKNNLVRLTKQHITIPFRDWWDGATLLDAGFLAWAIGLKYDDELYTENAKVATVSKLYPWVLGFVNENCETIAEFRRVEGSMFKNLVPYRATINGVEYCFDFRPEIDSCDHSAGQKASGSNNGGHKRCELCAASFHPLDRAKLFNFAAMVKTTPKDLPTLFKLRQEKNWKDLFQAIGQREFPPIFNGDTRTPLNERKLDHLQQAPDNLHNIKGALKVLVQYEKNEHAKIWNDNLFLINVSKYLKRAGWFVFQCN